MDRVSCDRKMLTAFLGDGLDEDDRLDVLLHLDTCARCWEAVYAATKAEHPHFYKSRTSKPRKTRSRNSERISEVA